MFFATIFFMIMKICVKMLPHIPPMEVVFFRCIISFFITFVILKRKKIKVLGKNRFLLSLRGIFGTIGLYLYFIIIQEIPLATASTLIYLTPLFSSLIGIFFLQEKMTFLQWILLLIAFFGILLIQGFDDRISLYYVLIGAGGSLCAAIAYSIIRYLKHEENSLVIMIYFPMIAFPVGGFFSYFNWIVPSYEDLFVLISIGILTQFAQYFMTRAYQSTEISKVSIVSYVEILFVIAVGSIYFNENFTILVYVGMFLVTVGVIINVIFFKNVKQNI